jgi:hypothetical protein
VREAGGTLTRVDHRQLLLRAAIDERFGYQVGSDRLVHLALDALLSGVDTPALRQLAGLGQGEEPEAHDLLVQVVNELGLSSALPQHQPRTRWERVRWWCRYIVDGHLPPEEAGRLIWVDGWSELGHPPALQPLIGWVSEWEDWTEHHALPRQTYRQLIVDEARRLLAGPWPPTTGTDRRLSNPGG